MNTKLKFIVLFITLVQALSACTTPFAAATSMPKVLLLIPGRFTGTGFFCDAGKMTK